MEGPLSRVVAAAIVLLLMLGVGSDAATVVLLGETITCDASLSEGHPIRFEWYVTEPLAPPPTQPTATGVSLPLLLHAPGTWTVELIAFYSHQSPDGGSYQSQTSVTIDVRAVVAEIALSSTYLSTEEPLDLDGSSSRWASGVTPLATWKIDASPWGPCNGGPPPTTPSDLHCTIPAGALAPGDHVAKLQLYDPVSGDIHQRVRAFTVYEIAPLSVDFVWEPFNPDPDELVQLEILVEPASAANDLVTATWEWDEGGPPQQVPCNPYGCLFWSHRFAQQGWYDVHLVVATDEETAEVTHTIQIGDPPVAPTADFTASPPDPQLMHEVTFTFTGSCQEPCSYDWSFGDGATASTPSPLHAYVLPGAMTATLTVSNDGGSDSAQAPIQVTPCWSPPPPSQEGGCYGGPVALAAAAGAAWLWSTGATSRSIVVGQPGGYWVDVDSGASCWGHAEWTVELVNCGDPGGDANLDGTVDAADLPALIRELTDGDGDTVTASWAGELTAPGGDVNRDGLLNAADLEAILVLIFGAP